MLGLPFALGAFSRRAWRLVRCCSFERSGLKVDVLLVDFHILSLAWVCSSYRLTQCLYRSRLSYGQYPCNNARRYAATGIIGFCFTAILLAKWKDLMVTFFDENHARTIGLRPNLLKAIFFILLSASVVAAMQTVGAFLVVALVVTPGATAYLLCDRFPTLDCNLRLNRFCYQFFWGLYQLLFGWRDRWHHCNLTNNNFPASLCFCAQTWFVNCETQSKTSATAGFYRLCSGF